MRLRKKQFTLIELLTVVAIIAVLAGMALGIMSVVTRKMADAKTQSLIQRISIALEAYKAKYGYYIQQSTAGVFYLDQVDETLTAGSTDTKFIQNNFCQFVDYAVMKAKDTTTSGGKYWLVDGFGQNMIYRCPGFYNKGGFDLGSVGADGKWGNNVSSFSLSTLESDMKTKQFGQGDDLANFTR